MFKKSKCYYYNLRIQAPLDCCCMDRELDTNDVCIQDWNWSYHRKGWTDQWGGWSPRSLEALSIYLVTKNSVSVTTLINIPHQIFPSSYLPSWQSRISLSYSHCQTGNPHIFPIGLHTSSPTKRPKGLQHMNFPNVLTCQLVNYFNIDQKVDALFNVFSTLSYITISTCHMLQKGDTLINVFFAIPWINMLTCWPVNLLW